MGVVLYEYGSMDLTIPAKGFKILWKTEVVDGYHSLTLGPVFWLLIRVQVWTYRIEYSFGANRGQGR
jgi:hypothetical protein